ncbi:MAG: TMEM175 family protein [Ferruginibacter sp.]
MNTSFSPLPATEKHPKQDFQVERIAFFSDAVFAIAITLLVIEFRPPLITKDTTYPELWHVLKELKFKFAALVLSFILIITYWVRHHTIFKHVHNYNRSIIFANMLLLLPIIFFPFTTSFLYENLSSDNDLLVIPFRFFIFNNIIACITMFIFYWMVTRRFTALSFPITKIDAAEFEKKLVILTLSFVLVFIISFFSFKNAGYGLVPVALFVIYTRVMTKKNSLHKKNIHAKQNSSTAD